MIRVLLLLLISSPLLAQQIIPQGVLDDGVAQGKVPAWVDLGDRVTIKTVKEGGIYQTYLCLTDSADPSKAWALRGRRAELYRRADGTLPGIDWTAFTTPLSCAQVAAACYRGDVAKACPVPPPAVRPWSEIRWSPVAGATLYVIEQQLPFPGSEWLPVAQAAQPVYRPEWPGYPGTCWRIVVGGAVVGAEICGT